MFGIGMPEMLLLLALALIVIGPKKLPDLARSLGRAMREFKKATNELKETLDLDEDLSEVKNAFNDLKKDTTDLVTGTSTGKEGTEQADTEELRAGMQTTETDALEVSETGAPSNDDGAPEEEKPAIRTEDGEPGTDKKLDDLKKAFDDWSVKEKSSDGDKPGDPENDSLKPKERAEDA